jgi:hypothetical protein
MGNHPMPSATYLADKLAERGDFEGLEVLADRLESIDPDAGDAADWPRWTDFIAFRCDLD